MLRLILHEPQLTIHDTLSQDPSSDHASTAVQQGSTGTRTPPQGQHPLRAEYHGEKKEDRMKHDLLGMGSQFGSNK